MNTTNKKNIHSNFILAIGSAITLGSIFLGSMSASAIEAQSNVSFTGGNFVSGVYTGSFNIPPVYIPNRNLLFRDIGDSWAELYIRRLARRGIISNMGIYRPNDYMTRAEFLKILIKTTGWELPTTNLYLPFDDVMKNYWYAPYVSLGLEKGIITNDNISYKPNYTITRAEVAKMLMITLGVTMATPTDLTFTDTDIGSDLTNYIEASNTLDIVSGQMFEGKRIFRPNESITRAETAKVIARAFELE